MCQKIYCYDCERDITDEIDFPEDLIEMYGVTMCMDCFDENQEKYDKIAEEREG